MTKRRSSGEKNLPIDYEGNCHPSKMAAHRVLLNTAKGQTTLVRKTLQAGATTGIISACLDRKEFFCLIGPTRKNVSEVMQGSIKYSDRADLKTLAAEDKPRLPLKTLPTKMDCPYVKAEIEACKDKAKIPIFFPDCKKCADAATCDPYQYLLRGGDDDDEGIGITMAALRAALHSEKRDRILGFTEVKELSWGSLKMRIIRSKAKIFIIDECHALEVPESKRVTVMDVTNNIIFDFKTIYAAVIEANRPAQTGELAGYESLRREGPYAYVEEIIEMFCAFVNSTEMQAEIQKIRERMQNPEHARQLHVERVPNPYRLDLDDPSNVGYYAGVIDQLHQMYEDIGNKQLRLHSDEVLDLLTMFYVVCADYITIQIDHNAGNEYVDVVAIDHIGERMLKNFMKEMLDESRRGILLSATPSDFKYSSLAKNGKVKEMFFNAGHVDDDNRGDPTGSCKKQMIIGDTWKLQHRGTYSLHNRMDYIMSAIELMFDVHGRDCAVICKSKKELEIIKKEMVERGVEFAVTDYYRSPDAVSTVYTNEVWQQIKVAMLIGAAEIPVHSMDVFSKSAEESARKRLANVYQATYQMTGRVKNPSIPSLVYCIGINTNEVENFTTWGTEYAVVDTGKEHDSYTVKVKKAVAKPILQNAKDIEDMIFLGAQHMGIEYDPLIPWTTETKNSLAPQCCTSLNRISGEVFSDTGESKLRYCTHFAQPQALYYIYKASTKNNLFLSFRMTSIRAEICECMRNNFDVQIWGSHGFDFSTIQNFDVIDSGEGHDEDEESELEEIDEVQHTESELDEPGKDADTVDDPQAHRLNSFEQNYPIGDAAELLGLPIDVDYPDLKKEYTVESWAAWEDHLNEQFKAIRVSPGWYCDNTLTFLHHVFATRPDLIYIQQVTNGKQSYYAKKRSAYITMEAQMTWIDRHTAGTITIGSPCIDENGNVKWGCYDIDAHQSKNDTSSVLIKKRYWAELKTMKLLAYLHKKGIPYILERSGSTASYHIWISVVPVDAKLAMWTFRAIALAAGVTDLEINPKQGRAGAKGSGNQVKLPFGKHQANKSRSKLWINGEWVGPRVSNRGYSLPGEFVDIMHRAIDIREVDMEGPKLVRIADIPEVYLVEDGREYCRMESVEYTSGSGEYAGIRRFFVWLLTQDLSGEQGHWARIYLAREFLNAGWTHEDIARLFEHQSDYDFDESLKGVKSVAGKDYGNVQYESIWLRCSSFAAKYEQETGYHLSTSEAAAAY